MHKEYHLPEAPYRRLLARDDVSSEQKQLLIRQMQALDPVLLLKQIREAQDTPMAFSQNRTPEAVASDISAFVNGLAIVWRSGELRPTHRQEVKPGRWSRTHTDAFAEV